MWFIQKNPMLKDFRLCNPNYTYTLCKFGLHNPECISLVILVFICTSMTYIILVKHNENLDNTYNNLDKTT